MNKNSLLVLSVLILLLSSCQYHVEKSAAGSADPVTQNEKNIDFQTVRELILAPQCIGCHQQYESYGSVLNELKAIQEAVNSNRMPKTGGPLTANQKSVLAQWISMGAPEHSQTGTPQPPPPPRGLEPTWISLSEKVIFPKCLACHNPQGQARFLDLSSRKAIYAGRDRMFGDSKLLDFADPEKSYFMLILRDTQEPMPPTWSNIPRLNEEELNIMSRWIAEGLP